MVRMRYVQDTGFEIAGVLQVELPAAISTKTAKVGDRISAYLTNDLVVDGKVVAKAGAMLQGSVSQVVSGSDKIGGTATLGTLTRVSRWWKPWPNSWITTPRKSASPPTRRSFGSSRMRVQ